jgi:hypothetical protein
MSNANKIVSLLGSTEAQSSVLTAQISAIRDGVPYIALSGEGEPIKARTIVKLEQVDPTRLVGASVLVALDSAPDGVPIIIGLVSETIFEGEPSTGESDVSIIEAKNELRLRCGKSTLVLRRDGTVLVKGRKITSRAAEANKIKGATINLN